MNIRKVSSFPDPLLILPPLNDHFCQESSVSLLPAAPLITITRNNPAVMSSKLLLPGVNQQVSLEASCITPPFLETTKSWLLLSMKAFICLQRHSPQRLYKLNKNKMGVRHCYHQNVAIVKGQQGIDCVKL